MIGLEQIYYACFGIGSIYILGTALLGHFHTDSGGQDTGHSHGLDPSESSGHAHTEHLSPYSHLSHGLTHTLAPHSPDSISDGHETHSDSSHNDHSNLKSDGHKVGISNTDRHNRSGHSTDDLEKFYFRLLKIISPLRLSLCLFLFGAAGILCLQFWPILGPLSFLPALFIGIIGANTVFSLINRALLGLDSSSNFQNDSLIGSIGELTLPVGSEQTGEVVIAGRGGRYMGPAKPYDAKREIKKLSKVIIADYRDGIFYVEPFDDTSNSVIEFNKDSN